MLKNLCILPWIHIEADPMGRAKPCCLYEDELGSLTTDTLKDIWNGEKIQQLRKEFLEDKRPIGCKQCWTTDDANGESKRVRDNRRFGKRHQSRFNSQIDNVLPPVYYDLKLGTVCNLKCRTCSTASSFKWEEDEIELYGESLNPNVKSYWINDDAPIWTELTNSLPYAEFFDFSGGEPFLIKRHVELLRECVEKDYARNISIHYNTNGSIMPQKELFELWKEFKDVEIMVSMDSTGSRFEYMRHPANWKIAEHNFDYFNSLYYVTATICYTVSLFTLYYIPEFIQWAKSKELEDWQYFFNLMVAPTYLSINNIPPDAYDLFETKLSNVKESQQFVEIMKNQYYNERDRFRWITSDLDKFRKENFQQTFPEIYKHVW